MDFFNLFLFFLGIKRGDYMDIKKKHFSLQYLPFVTEDTVFDESNKLVQLDINSKVPIAGVPNVYEKYSDLDGSGYSMKSDDWIPLLRIVRLGLLQTIIFNMKSIFAY